MTPEQGADVRTGDILQISPENNTNGAFGACFMVVSELKSWGVQGYVQALGENRDGPGGQAYIRLKWDEIEPTGGRAVWTTGSLSDADE